MFNFNTIYGPPAILFLEDGRYFNGFALGSEGETTGEEEKVGRGVRSRQRGPMAAAREGDLSPASVNGAHESALAAAVTS